MGNLKSRIQPCFQCLRKSNKEYEFHKKIGDVMAMISPKESADFKEAFNTVADEKEEVVDAYQLKDALNTAFKKDFQFEGFTIDMCRSMVAQKDYDMSGTLGYDESKELWADILMWRNAFVRLDTNNDGYIDGSKIDTLLNFVGIKVSGKTAKIIVIRYTDREGKMYFADFISCILKLKSMTEVYAEQKEHSPGKNAKFTVDEFIQMTVYC